MQAKASVKNARPGVDKEAIAKLLAKQSPLQYMLMVMQDETADPVRRDRMAHAAAAFCHSRYTIEYVGKKETRAADSKTAGDGTAWGKLLRPPETISAKWSGTPPALTGSSAS
jgi:hypothetical protein